MTVVVVGELDNLKASIEYVEEFMRDTTNVIRLMQKGFQDLYEQVKGRHYIYSV